MTCRKNYRDLTADEKDRFVAALHHLKATGVIDQYASDHENFFHSAHHSAHFLPWHREFLRRFEDELRSFDPGISIPYWNSTEDTSASDPLWDNDFLGQFDAAWNLDRVLEADTMPTPQAVLDTLDLATYDAFWSPLESNIHNPPHRWVDGVMATAASPGDPVFYLHHAWIDMLWAQWQLMHPSAPFVGSGPGEDVDDAMAPWTTTPDDVLDHRSIGSYNYPAGFLPDVPVVGLATPAVVFLDVPEGETRLAAAMFDVSGCGQVQLTVTAGPTVTNGPAGTSFGVLSSPVFVPSEAGQGRVWLSYTGTGDGDSATGTLTISCAETGEDFEVAITANSIARPTAAVMLVLDRSNSMNFDSGIDPSLQRADVLQFSAPPAVDVAEDGNAVGVISFDHDAHPMIGVTPVAGGGRGMVNGSIASYAPNPNGWTSIGEGLALAHSTLDPVGGYDVKATVVLTDGQENHGPHDRRYISDVEDLIDERVFAIGLGRPEVLNAAALEDLCNGTQGYMLMTGDLDADSYFRLAKYYQQIFAGVTSNEIVLDPEGSILPGQEHRIPFWLNEADITARAVLLTPEPTPTPGSAPSIRMTLETPDGDVIDPAVALGHPMIEHGFGTGVQFYRFGLPLPLPSGQARAGRWHIVLRVDADAYKRYLSSLDNYPILFRHTAAHGIRYCANVHAYSNLRMRASLSQDGHEPGARLIVRSILTEYGIPALGATCRAELTRPDGTATVLSMAEVEPGVFEVVVETAIAGLYAFRVLAEGRTMRGRPFTREQLLTGAVWAGGDRPPTTSQDDPRGREDLCELLLCLLDQRSIRELLERARVKPEEVRRCIELYCRRSRPRPRPGGGHHDLADALRPVVASETVLEAILDEVERHGGS